MKNMVNFILKITLLAILFCTNTFSTIINLISKEFGTDEK
ncbi:MAG: hypothetical protein PWR19_970 [Carnobacterium sp.]|uniref:Uncharacterized protein n=1 Tax=Carnobacterium inhibens subsp. gilichinskyi TaxID=1266845 RepID=U5SF75_9LACT|nr:hypothetical protein Q783_00350 [Carnobacterium inhibens subsp. gilichinskyi]MDN5371924.1 hypothetical protein [Carnobacterium sp.]